MPLTVKPLRDEVLVRLIEPARCAGTLQLPDRRNEERVDGVVVRLGPLCRGLVQRGDRVIVPPGAVRGTIHKGAVDYRLIREPDIPAVIEEKMED